MDIHAIAPVGRSDDILHQRAPRSWPLRAFTEVFAVAIEMPGGRITRHSEKAGRGVYTEARTIGPLKCCSRHSSWLVWRRLVDLRRTQCLWANAQLEIESIMGTGRFYLGKSGYQKLATMVSRSKRFRRCHRENLGGRDAKHRLQE
jgi:hypothetical protein